MEEAAVIGVPGRAAGARSGLALVVPAPGPHRTPTRSAPRCGSGSPGSRSPGRSASPTSCPRPRPARSASPTCGRTSACRRPRLGFRGCGSAREELAALRGHTLPDLVGPGLRLLFVGINPGLWTAALQSHFGHPGNRFYPALYRAGIAAVDRRAPRLSPEDRRPPGRAGASASPTWCRRATARADELTRTSLSQRSARSRRLSPRTGRGSSPSSGVTAYRTAFALPRAASGRQPEAWPARSCGSRRTPAG